MFFNPVIFNPVICILARMLPRPLLYLIRIQCLIYEDAVLCLEGRERHTSRRQQVRCPVRPGGYPSRTYWHQSLTLTKYYVNCLVHKLTYKHMHDNAKKKKNCTLGEVVSVSDKASVTQMNVLILRSVKVAGQSWSGGCPPPKAPSLHLRLPVGVRL